MRRNRNLAALLPLFALVFLVGFVPASRQKEYHVEHKLVAQWEATGTLTGIAVIYTPVGSMAPKTISDSMLQEIVRRFSKEDGAIVTPEDYIITELY